MSFEEHTETIRVPENTGVDGFLHTLREILKLSRVQQVVIDARGSVTYRRWRAPGETEPTRVDYSGLEPSAIMRYGDVQEVVPRPAEHPPALVARMFDQASQESLAPVAFVSGGATQFWSWYGRYVPLQSRTELYGVPFIHDKRIPDTTLVLCVAYSRGSSLLDCHRFLMVNMDMPDTRSLVETRVNVL